MHILVKSRLNIFVVKCHLTWRKQKAHNMWRLVGMSHKLQSLLLPLVWTCSYPKPRKVLSPKSLKTWNGEFMLQHKVLVSCKQQFWAGSAFPGCPSLFSHSSEALWYVWRLILEVWTFLLLGSLQLDRVRPGWLSDGVTSEENAGVNCRKRGHNSGDGSVPSESGSNR